MTNTIQKSIEVPIEMEKKTEFFALHRRISPIAHLSILRGPQSDQNLLDDGYFSPALHNVPDTYIRYLQSQSKVRRSIPGTKTMHAEARREQQKSTFALKIQDKAKVFISLARTKILDNKSSKREKSNMEYFARKEMEKMGEQGWMPGDLKAMQSPGEKKGNRSRADGVPFFYALFYRKKTPPHAPMKLSSAAIQKRHNFPIDPKERKAKLLRNLMAVRRHILRKMRKHAVAHHTETFKAKAQQKLKDSYKHFGISLLRLRLQMLSNHVFTIDKSKNVDFVRKDPTGAHSVEFKGPLRELILEKELCPWGGYIDRAAELANFSDFWKHNNKDGFFDELLRDDYQTKMRNVLVKKSWERVRLIAEAQAAKGKKKAAEDMANTILRSVLLAAVEEPPKQKVVEKRMRALSIDDTNESDVKRRKPNL